MENIIENNRLIAEFMGARMTLVDHTHGNEEYCKENGLDKWLIPTWSKPEGFNDDWGWGKYQLGKWEYHKSYDWLMPVVDKIEILFEGSLIVVIKDSRCFIEQDTQYAVSTGFKDNVPKCYSGFASSKIEAIYLTCVEFIKWYNSQI